MEGDETMEVGSSRGPSPSLPQVLARLPPEIWEKIFDNLLESQDCLRVSAATPYFQEVLSGSKASWLFEPSFPHVFSYLTKQDILHCRLCSKRWRFAVNTFMENNIFQRPASSKQYLEGRLVPMSALLRLKNLGYNNFSNPDSLANVLADHSRYPQAVFMGRAVHLRETQQNLGQQPGNLEFMQTFGKSLYFLQLSFGCLPPADICRRTLELLHLCPNLKKLDVYGGISLQYLQRAGLSEQELSTQLTEFITQVTPHMSQWARALPQLETLDCCISGPGHQDAKRFIFQVFTLSQSVQSLTITGVPMTPGSQLRYLTDLTIPVESDAQLHCLRTLQAPLHRLLVLAVEFMVTDSLLALPHSFKDTLCTFGMQFGPYFFYKMGKGRGLAEQRKPFTNPRIWEGLNKLTRVQLKGKLAFSLNFLWGLRDHLEWLHFAPIPPDLTSVPLLFFWACLCEYEPQDGREVERTDLLECLRKASSNTERGTAARKTVYESQVWSVFPKLKGISIMNGLETLAQNEVLGKEIMYRREAHEWHKRHKQGKESEEEEQES